jgi:hypothetical protein
MTIVNTQAGAQILAQFLDGQVKRLVDNVSDIHQSNQPRVSRLYAIYSAIIEDAISIKLLCENGRTNASGNAEMNLIANDQYRARRIADY